MNYSTIGKFIQEKRKEKRLTQKELAQKLGVTDKAVSKWERGLGCPDVSILEVLANELGVSILEILKGRIIENEIKVTEANDYITETINYTKNNIKETTNRIIAFIIISITLLLLLLNIENIISMNKKYEYNFDNERQEKIKNNVNEIEKNTNIILRNQGKYSKEDYEIICKTLKENLESLKNMTIINEKGTKRYTKNELYLLDVEDFSDINQIKLSRILEKYSDNTIKTEVLIDNVAAQLFLGINLNINNSFEYKLFKTNNNDLYPIFYDDMINLRVIRTKSKISTYLYITEQIIKVGEINE